jgi:hypothetical protein
MNFSGQHMQHLQQFITHLATQLLSICDLNLCSTYSMQILMAWMIATIKDPSATDPMWYLWCG